MGEAEFKLGLFPGKKAAQARLLTISSPLISSASGTALKGPGVREQASSPRDCCLRLPRGLILAIWNTSFSYFLSNFCKKYNGSHNSSFDNDGDVT